MSAEVSLRRARAEDETAPSAPGPKRGLPPGPRLGLRHLLWFQRDPTAAMADLTRRYGDLVTFPTYGPFGRLVAVADPEAIRHVFATGPPTFVTGEANAIMLEPVVGAHSVLSLDGEPHKRSRKLMLPPLHGSRVRGYEPIVREITEREIARWPRGEPFPVVESLRTIALALLMRLMLGVRDESRFERFREAVAPVASPPDSVTWVPALRRHLGPWSPWSRFVRARERLDVLLYEEIADRRRDPELEERDDILSMMIQARDEDGAALTDLEVRDEVMGLMGAGHHTTTAAVAWLLDQVLRRPAVEARLREEIASGDDAYLEATIDETLRWRAPIFSVPRRTTCEAELGGYLLPAGTYMSLVLHLVHRRPDVYPEPEEFRPERFLEGRPGGAGWIPYGGGDRRCVGAAFAGLEMKVITRTIFENVKLRLADARPEKPSMSYVILFPERGVPVVAEGGGPR